MFFKNRIVYEMWKNVLYLDRSQAEI